jgi:hypothetical protein
LAIAPPTIKPDTLRFNGESLTISRNVLRFKRDALRIAIAALSFSRDTPRFNVESLSFSRDALRFKSESLSIKRYGLGWAIAVLRCDRVSASRGYWLQRMGSGKRWLSVFVFWVLTPIALLLCFVSIVEHSKNGGGSGDRDCVGVVAKVFLHLSRMRQVSDREADAGGSGGDSSGKRKKDLFHDSAPCLIE